MPDKTQSPCRCECGYPCGGPGTCETFTTDFRRCIDEHYKVDCDHDWTGPVVQIDVMGCQGDSASCATCGQARINHDMRSGI